MVYVFVHICHNKQDVIRVLCIWCYGPGLENDIIEIVQEPVRKLKAETIDKALQQIREACDVLESDSNIEQFLVFKQHILAGTSIYKNCLMEKAKKKKQQKLLDFYVFNC